MSQNASPNEALDTLAHIIFNFFFFTWCIAAIGTVIQIDYLLANV